MKPGPGGNYIQAFRDKDGNHFDGGKSYRLHVPANPPAAAFWSLTAYDSATRSMVQNPTNDAAHVLPEHFHGHPRQSQGAPGLLRLGVSVGTYRAPDVDMGRYWRVGVRVALQVDMIPPQRTRLFGSDADQETQDNVGVQAVCPSRPGGYRHADHLATEMTPTVMSTNIDIGPDLVGDTGIEPVTSSV
jgi:Protein of unknown function (DUF1214)